MTHRSSNRTDSAMLYSVSLIAIAIVVMGVVALGLEASDNNSADAASAVLTDTVAVAMTYDPALVSQGELQYSVACSSCHGTNLRGITGLGKDLLDSAFVLGLDDAQFHQFITVGRPITDPLNTTGVAMPARGLNPTLTDVQIDAIIAYIRTNAAEAGFTPGEGGMPMAGMEGMEGMEGMGMMATPAPQAESDVPLVPVEFVPPIAFTYPVPPLEPRPYDASAGYQWSCAGCHGGDGRGIDGLGPALTDSDLLDPSASDALFEFLTVPSANYFDTGVGFVHPLRGEAPALNDDELRDLINYLYTLPAVTGE
jgi:disulfide bond formation protein DsbB